MLTAAVVQSDEVRAGFEKIGWVNMSQSPIRLELQGRLYEQLTGGEKVPRKADSVELRLEALQSVAAAKTILVVLVHTHHKHAPLLIVLSAEYPSTDCEG